MLPFLLCHVLALCVPVEAGRTVDIAGEEEDLEIRGARPASFFGSALASGDLNGDSFPDLLIGEPGPALAVDGLGQVHVFFGGPHLFATPTVDLAESAADWTLVGEANGDWLGSAVTALDFNRDGLDDLAVGAPFAGTAGHEQCGKVLLFFGEPRASGTVTHLASEEADVVVIGSGTGAELGCALSFGDVNGDQSQDLIIGARGHSPTGMDAAGAVYVLLGGTHRTGGTTIDMATEHADLTVLGANAGDSLGSAVCTLDYNSDGKADIAVGAPNHEKGPVQYQTGAAYVILGRESYDASILDLSFQHAPLEIHGQGDSDTFGESISSGDVNADGASDLIVGARYAPQTPPDRQWAGVVYVFLGIDGFEFRPIPIDLAINQADITIVGWIHQGSIGETVLAADLGQDGYADIVIATKHYLDDTLVLEGTQFSPPWPQTLELYSTTPDIVIQDSGFKPFGFQDLETGLAAGDFDRDGVLDLVLSSTCGNGRVHIIRQRKCDLDSDNEVDRSDLHILVRSRRDGGTLGDINRDSVIDFLDVALLSRYWFQP